MGRFTKLKGLSPSDFVDPRRFDEARQSAASQYDLMGKPDILPQDEPRFNEIVSKYLDQADELASRYQKDRSIDLTGEISGVRNQLQKEIQGGEIAAMKIRKQGHDNLMGVLKRSKTPEEYNEAIKNLEIEPLNFTSLNDGGYGQVKLKEYYSEADEKFMNKTINDRAKSIRPDQYQERFLQDKDFVKSYNYDVYNSKKVKQILFDSAADILADEIEASEAFGRYIRQNPNDPLRNEDGTYNFGSKFGKKLKSAAEAVANKEESRAMLTLNDPKFQKDMAYLRDKLKDDEDKTYVLPNLDILRKRVGPQKLTIPDGPAKFGEAHPAAHNKKSFDDKQVNDIIYTLEKFSDVSGVVRADLLAKKSFKLPHQDYLIVTRRDTDKKVLVDLRLPDDEFWSILDQSFSLFNTGDKGQSNEAAKMNNE